jgi:hypothetical protein
MLVNFYTCVEVLRFDKDLFILESVSTSQLSAIIY